MLPLFTTAREQSTAASIHQGERSHPWHPPNIHAAQVLMVSGLVNQACCLALTGEGQGWCGQHTQQRARQAAIHHVQRVLGLQAAADRGRHRDGVKPSVNAGAPPRKKPSRPCLTHLGTATVRMQGVKEHAGDAFTTVLDQTDPAAGPNPPAGSPPPRQTGPWRRHPACRWSSPRGGHAGRSQHTS